MLNLKRTHVASVVKFKLTPYSTLILGVFPLHQIATETELPIIMYMLGVNERMGLKL